MCVFVCARCMGTRCSLKCGSSRLCSPSTYEFRNGTHRAHSRDESVSDSSHRAKRTNQDHLATGRMTPVWVHRDGCVVVFGRGSITGLRLILAWVSTMQPGGGPREIELVDGTPVEHLGDKFSEPRPHIAGGFGFGIETDRFFSNPFAFGNCQAADGLFEHRQG